MSQIFGEDGLLWTNRSNDSPSLLNQRLGSFQSTPTNFRRENVRRETNPLAQSHNAFRGGKRSPNIDEISCETLAQILSRGGEDMQIGGTLNIGGKVFTLAPPRRTSAATHQRYAARQNSMEEAMVGGGGGGAGGPQSRRDDLSDRFLDNIGIPNFYNPPMNEQSSLDDPPPIMEFNKTMQPSQSQYARLSRVVSVPEPEETIRAAHQMVTGGKQQMGSYFTNFKGVQSNNVTINQNISEGTLSAGLSNKSPESIGLLQSSGKSPSLDFQLSLYETTKKLIQVSPKVNNFFKPVPEESAGQEEATPAKVDAPIVIVDDDDNDDDLCNNGIGCESPQLSARTGNVGVAAPKIIEPKEFTIQIKEESPPREQTVQPLLGKIDFSKARKGKKAKKKNLVINIDTAEAVLLGRDSTGQAPDKEEAPPQEPLSSSLNAAAEEEKKIPPQNDVPANQLPPQSDSIVTVIPKVPSPKASKTDTYAPKPNMLETSETKLDNSKDASQKSGVAETPATVTAETKNPEEPSKVATPEVRADLPSVQLGNLVLGKKKKKRATVTINLDSNLSKPSTAPTEAKASPKATNSVTTFDKTLTQPQPSPTNSKMPELKMSSGVSKKSIFCDFLNELESELSEKKDKKSRKKKKNQLEKVTAFNNGGPPSEHQAAAAHKQQISLNELDQEFKLAQLKRSNSDSSRSKDELMSKRIILRELQELKESFNYQQEQNKSEIDFTFLHASPIFIQGTNEEKNSLVALKFQDEKKAIVEAIKSSGKRIKFRQSVATKDKFIEMIRKRPECLHISCHGFDQTERSMRLQQEEDMRNLLFESENGEGRLISQRELNKILKQAITKIQVVFVAACMSQFVGEIFQQCDVPHVICAQQGKSILDNAAISFARFFYLRLFQGETICQAFQQSKNEVSFQHGDEEANRFQLLISKGQFKHSPKRCTYRFVRDNGPLDCRSVHIKYKSIRAKAQNFIPREIEFSKLVSCLQDESRLVHFRGLPGIGKTVLTRNVLHFLSERKYFPGGIIYESLNDIKSAHAFLLNLRNTCLKFFKMTPQLRHELTQATCTEGAITDFMTNLFDDHLTQYKLKKDKNFSENDKRFLLVLDNAESLIEEAGEEFRNLLSCFSDSCKMLKILIISRNELGPMHDADTISPLILPQLGSKQAVQFFLDLIGEEKRQKIQTEEIVELILGQVNYPVHKILPESTALKQPITPEFKAEFSAQIEALFQAEATNCKVVEILAHHHLFYLLQGNPTSLSRAAYVFNDPFNTKISSLLDLYQQVKQNNDLACDDETPASEDTRPKPRLNNESIETTTKMMIDMLPTQDARNLLYFIGCLPGGVSFKHLCQMWGKNEVERDIPTLERFNLLETPHEIKEKSFEMSPVLYQFIQQDIDKQSLTEFMEEIIRFSVTLLKQFYRSTDLLTDGASTNKDLNSHSEIKDFAMHSLIKSSDSINFSQLNELKKGLSYEKDYKPNMLASGRTLLANSLVQEGSRSKFQIPIVNLDFCLKFLTSINPDQNESPFPVKNNSSSGSGVLNVSGSANGADESLKSCKGSVSKVFESTWKNQTIDLSAKDGRSFAQELSKHNIKKTFDQQRRKSLMSLQKFNSVSSIDTSLLHPNIVVKQATSSTTQKSNESSGGSPQQQPQQQQQVTFLGLASGRDRRKTHLQQKSSQLDVIEESHHERDLNHTRNSQYTEEGTNSIVQQLLSQTGREPSMVKQDSSPFNQATPFSPAISPDNKTRPSVPNRFRPGIKKIQSEELGPIEQLSNNALTVIQETLKVVNPSRADFGSVLSTADECMNKLKLRQSRFDGSVGQRVDSNSLNPAVLNKHAIYSNEDADDSDENSFNSEDSNSDIDYNALKEGNSVAKGIFNISSLNKKKSSMINVSQMNLNSDRKLEDDPLQSVREGSDFCEDSDSQLDPDQPQSPDIQIVEATEQGSSGNFESSFGINAALNMQQPNTERRHTVNHGGMGRGSDDLRAKNRIDMAASVINHSRQTSILYNKVSHAFKRKNTKMMKELNRSARFTIRGSNRRNSKASIVFMPKKKILGQNNDDSEGSPLSEQDDDTFKSREKMSLYGEFLVYVVAYFYIVGEYQPAFQICSTEFERGMNSLLFKGNFMRFKALSAEQMFAAYSTNMDQDDIDFPVIPILIEAIESAKKALETYDGRVDGQDVGMPNKYGLGLANFHLGYLYATYAPRLCSSQKHPQGCEEFLEERNATDFRVLAKTHFAEAYTFFSEVNHLKGMYLTKQHEAQLLGLLSSGSNASSGDDLQIQQARRLAMEHLDAYRSYINKNQGRQLSAHIAREHGEVISLLVEIVDSNRTEPLFKSSNSIVKHRSRELKNILD